MITSLQGAGLGLRRALLPELLSMDAGAVDFLECAPDNWIGVGGSYGNALATLAERYPLSCHGLSLSLGGPMPLDHAFLRRAQLYSLKAQGVVLGTQPEVTSLAISEGKTPSRWAL